MSEGLEIIERLAIRLDAELGPAAPRVFQILVAELGGLRFTFPDLSTLKRLERNKRIRDSFRGNNILELAITHNLHPSQIRRIVRVQPTQQA